MKHSKQKYILLCQDQTKTTSRYIIAHQHIKYRKSSTQKRDRKKKWSIRIKQTFLTTNIKSKSQQSK